MLGITSPGKPPECSTRMCFLERRSLCPFLLPWGISDECRAGRHMAGLRCLSASGSGKRRQRDTVTPAMHCLCVCKGRAGLSEHICVHQECLRPAQLWTPDRALTLLCVTPGTTPTLPVRFSSAALDRLIAGAPVC